MQGKGKCPLPLHSIPKTNNKTKTKNKIKVVYTEELTHPSAISGQSFDFDSMKRLRFGDIVEIKTPAPLVYAIYTHRHVKPPRYGPVIQVFDRLYDARPPDTTEIFGHPIRSRVLFGCGQSETG
jgi:hypothetical protein